MEYEFLCGKKINSKILYIKNEKQLYKLKSKNGNKNYYTCYYKSCNSRVEFLVSSNVCIKPKNFKDHEHQNREELKSINKILKSMIKKG